MQNDFELCACKRIFLFADQAHRFGKVFVQAGDVVMRDPNMKAVFAFVP